MLEEKNEAVEQTVQILKERDNTIEELKQGFANKEVEL